MCGIFGVDVGTFILMTLVLALPMAIGCIVYAKRVLPKKFYRIPNENGEIVELPYREPENAYHMGDEKMPGRCDPFAPLRLSIVFILINTVASAMGGTAGINMFVTGGGGALGQIIKDSGLGTYMAEGLTQIAFSG